MIKLRVYGVPVPQGSTRAFAVRKAGVPTGAVTVVHDDKGKVRSWRKAIMDEADARLPNGWDAGWPYAAEVTLIFFLPRPAAHYGKGRNLATVLPSAPPFPVGKRDDLDKLCRAVLDALTDAGIWRDDGQVCSLTARKCYAAAGERPGVEIEVTGLG